MSFHLPESARIHDHPTLGSTVADGNNGAFRIASPEPGWELFLIGSDCSELEYVGRRWEHVSVHAARKAQQRTPSWAEMVFVKRLCWDDEDIVVEYHPRRSEYSNYHPHVLHLWRPLDAELPRPPVEFVGPVTGWA